MKKKKLSREDFEKRMKQDFREFYLKLADEIKDRGEEEFQQNTALVLEGFCSLIGNFLIALDADSKEIAQVFAQVQETVRHRKTSLSSYN